MRLRYLLPFIFLCFLPSKASAVPAFVQGCSNAAFAISGQSCTLIGVVAGHAIIVSAVGYNNVCYNWSLTDTNGDMMATGAALVTQVCEIYPATGNVLSLSITCAPFDTGGNITVTASDRSIFSGNYIIVTEYSGIASTGGVGNRGCVTDGSNSNTNSPCCVSGVTGPGPISTGSITTTNSGDILIAMGWYVNTGGGTGLSAPSGFTQQAYYNTCTGCSGQVAHMLADRVPGATGTFSPTFAMSPNNGSWMGTQAAFVPSGAGPITPVKHRSQVIKHKRKKDNHAQILTAAL